MYIKEYLIATCNNWIAILSGIGMLFFAFVATFVTSDSTNLKNIFFLLSLISLFFASYKIWLAEYKKNINQVEIFFENSDVFVSENTNARGTMKHFAIGVSNLGTESVKIDAKVEVKLNSLEGIPLTLKNLPVQTSYLLNSKESVLFHLASWSSNHKNVVSFPQTAGNTVNKNYSLETEKSLDITIRVFGNRINCSKRFIFFLDNDKLQLREKINNLDELETQKIITKNSPAIKDNKTKVGKNFKKFSKSPDFNLLDDKL